MKDKIKELTKTSSQMILIGMCQDYMNYAKVKSYIDKDDFMTESYKKVFVSIQNIYDNYSYKTIDETAIETYAKEKNLDTELVQLLQATLAMSTKRRCNDFDGAFSTFRKNTGILKFCKQIDDMGGFDGFISNIYTTSNNAEDIKASLDSITRTSFKNYKSSSKMVDMGSGMLDYVRNRMFVKDGKTVDFMGMPLLQSYSKGIHVGMTGVLALSGMGKTSVTIPLFSIPVLEDSPNEKLLSIHNEQEEDEIRQLY